MSASPIEKSSSSPIEKSPSSSFELNSSTIAEASLILNRIGQKVELPKSITLPSEDLTDSLDTKENYVWKCAGSIFVLPDLITAQKLEKTLLVFCEKAKWSKYANSSSKVPLYYTSHLSVKSDVFSGSPSSTVFIDSIIIHKFGRKASPFYISSPHALKNNICAPAWTLRGTERKQHAFSVVPFITWGSSKDTILWINEDSPSDENHECSFYPYRVFKEQRKAVDRKLVADDPFFFNFLRSPSTKKIVISDPQGLRRMKIEEAGDVTRMLANFNGNLLAQTQATGNASQLKNVKVGHDSFQDWVFLQMGGGLIVSMDKALSFLKDAPMVWLEVARDEPMLPSFGVIDIFGEPDEYGVRPKQSVAAFFPKNFNRPPTLWFNRTALHIDEVSTSNLPLSVFGSEEMKEEVEEKKPASPAAKPKAKAKAKAEAKPKAAPAAAAATTSPKTKETSTKAKETANEVTTATSSTSTPTGANDSSVAVTREIEI